MAQQVFAQFQELCLHYRVCVGKKPVDALPKRTVMKIVVVTAFDSRWDMKLVEEGMKSRVLYSRVVPQAPDNQCPILLWGRAS